LADILKSIKTSEIEQGDYHRKRQERCPGSWKNNKEVVRSVWAGFWGKIR
jgi:hypothetical protein